MTGEGRREGRRGKWLIKPGKKPGKAALLLVVNSLFILLCFLVLIPVLYAFSVSLNADNSLLSSDFSFLPKAYDTWNTGRYLWRNLF